MSDKFLCEFCSHSFSSKSSLNSHQKKALYCLKLQECDKDSGCNKKFRCLFCDKAYTTKYNCIMHSEKCVNKTNIEELQLELQKYKDKLIDLEKKLEVSNTLVKEYRELLGKEQNNHQTLALTAVSRPTTSIKNTIKNAVIQNLLPLKENEMQEQLPLLTIDHIREGAEGYAKFALKHPLKDRITCTDVSRKKLAWKNEQGEIIYDTEGQILCKKFFAVIQEKSERLFKELIHELGVRLGRSYDRRDQEEADAIVELTDKVQTWRREAFQASKGSITDLSADFASYLCKMSVSTSIK